MRYNFKFCVLLIFAIAMVSCGKKSESVDLLPLKEGDGYHYFDTKGNEKISKKFIYAGVFKEDLAIVKLLGDREQYSFINKKGELAFGKTYRKVSVFSEGLAWVSPHNSYPTAIDKNGKEKFSIKNAERVKIFKDGLSAYSVKDSISEKWGFVDSSGKTVIQPKFEETGNFSEGLCAVKDEDGNWKYIDKKGTLKIEQSFNTAFDFLNGKAIVSDHFEEKFGIIDTEGKFLIEPKLDSIVYDKKDFLIKKEGKWGWIDATGKMLIEPKFEDAFPFADNDLAVVKQNGLYGFVDKKGAMKIDFQFKKAFSFVGEIAYVVPKNSEYGSFIDKQGNVVVKNKFSGISEDLITYLNNGNSLYEMIKTDYFDLESILKSINLNSPEGLSFNDKISSITSKLYHKKVSSNAEDDLTISYLRKISSDSYLSSYIIRDRNDKDKIAGFWYQIDMAGERNFDKGDEIEKALLKKLKGYTKIEAPNEFINQGRIKAFKNDKHILLVTGNIIEILSLKTPIENFDSRSYGNHQNTDTDDFLYSQQKSDLLRIE